MRTTAPPRDFAPCEERPSPRLQPDTDRGTTAFRITIRLAIRVGGDSWVLVGTGHFCPPTSAARALHSKRRGLPRASPASFAPSRKAQGRRLGRSAQESEIDTSPRFVRSVRRPK